MYVHHTRARPRTATREEVKLTSEARCTERSLLQEGSVSRICKFRNNALQAAYCSARGVLKFAGTKIAINRIYALYYPSSTIESSLLEFSIYRSFQKSIGYLRKYLFIEFMLKFYMNK